MMSSLLKSTTRRSRSIAIGFVVVAGVAACSSPPVVKSASRSAPTSPTSRASAAATQSAASSSQSTAPKKDIIAGLITFDGRLELSGAQDSRLSFHAFPGVTSPKSSCAHIAATGTPTAKGMPRKFLIPAPPLGGDVTFAAAIQPYRGPGAYNKSSVVAVGASVTIGSSTYNLLAPGASETVTFGADGSGKFSFSHARALQGGRALSGTIVWTCSV